MIETLLISLEGVTLKEVIYVFIGLGIGWYVLKSGLPLALFSKSSELVDMHSKEREILIRERDRALNEVEQLKTENRFLMREISQRIEINQEDKKEITELKRLLKT